MTKVKQMGQWRMMKRGSIQGHTVDNVVICLHLCHTARVLQRSRSLWTSLSLSLEGANSKREREREFLANKKYT